jgi:hypothetical protein
MSDTLETAQAAAPSDNGQSPELAAMMAGSLNPFLPQDKQIPVPQPPVVEQAAAQQDVVPRGTVEGQPAQQPITQPVVQPEAQPFQFSVLTEKYKWNTPEEAMKAIDELAAFKNAPGTPAEFKDAEAAAIYKGLSEGNYDLLREHLNRQHEVGRLSGLEVNKDTAAQIVKYGMQLKYGSLTPDEIDYKFNKQFSIPPKPLQQAGEDQTDYEDRVAEWQQVATDKQMELMIEAKMIRPEFDSAKKQFTFPKAIESTDEGYAQYQKMLENETQMQEETEKIYQAFQPAQLAVKLPFIDEPNKINFEFQHEPDKESFSKTIEILSDAAKFGKNFQKPDGTYDREKFAKVIHYGLNFEDSLIRAMTQAKNAAIKAQLPDNSQGGLVRQLPQGQEPNELDQHMRMAGIVRQ